MNKRSRRRHLEQVAGETRTMVFYEAPHKLRRTLSDFEKLFGGDRKIAVVRELTKVHEEAWRTTLGEAAAHYREKEPRGEYVLVVEGARPVKEEATLEDGLARVGELMEDGLSRKDAVKQAAKELGLSVIDASVVDYFNHSLFNNVYPIYNHQLAEARKHPLPTRRYMWKVEY